MDVARLSDGGGVAYAYKNQFFGLIGGEKGAGDPPLIQADKNPSKIKPADRRSKQASNSGKLIYDRLQDSAGGTKAAANERIVARQESVLDTSSIAAQLSDDKPGGDGSGSAMMKPDGMKPGAMAKGSGYSDKGSMSKSEAMAKKSNGLTGPRKVKTYAVKPDGTVMKPAMILPSSIPTALTATPKTSFISK